MKGWLMIVMMALIFQGGGCTNAGPRITAFMPLAQPPPRDPDPMRAPEQFVWQSQAYSEIRAEILGNRKVTPAVAEAERLVAALAAALCGALIGFSFSF